MTNQNKSSETLTEYLARTYPDWAEIFKSGTGKIKDKQLRLFDDGDI